MKCKKQKKLQFSGSLPSAKAIALDKDFFKKNKKISLPSALTMGLGKVFLKNKTFLCRVPEHGQSAKI
jgi:hypothetical protein